MGSPLPGIQQVYLNAVLSSPQRWCRLVMLLSYAIDFQTYLKPCSHVLQALQPAAFLRLLRAVQLVLAASLEHVCRVRAAVDALLRRGKAQRVQSVIVAQAFDDVLQHVTEAAHGRVVKLLASRHAQFFADYSGSDSDGLVVSCCNHCLASPCCGDLWEQSA